MICWDNNNFIICINWVPISSYFRHTTKIPFKFGLALRERRSSYGASNLTKVSRERIMKCGGHTGSRIKNKSLHTPHAPLLTAALEFLFVLTNKPLFITTLPPLPPTVRSDLIFFLENFSVFLHLKIFFLFSTISFIHFLLWRYTTLRNLIAPQWAAEFQLWYICEKSSWTINFTSRWTWVYSLSWCVCK